MFHQADSGATVQCFVFACLVCLLMLQGPLNRGEGEDDSAESQQQLIPTLAFDDHMGDSYRRVQRIRAKRVTTWMERPDTLPILLCSSLLLAPLERLMSGTQRVKSNPASDIARRVNACSLV